MEIRPYAETDAPATLSVFLAAVTETASVHYSAEQIASCPADTPQMIQILATRSRLGLAPKRFT